MVICIIAFQVLNFSNGAIMGLLGALGFIMTFFGIGLKLTSHGREINAFYSQQQMPVAKEGIEKMSPAMGTAAKEIAKGIKERLKDEGK